MGIYIQHTPSCSMLLNILILSVVDLGHAGDHHGDGHDDNCVDNSRYGELKNNVMEKDVCTYKVDRICNKKIDEICVPVQKETCEVVTFLDCKKNPSVSTQRDDETVLENFVTHDCYEDGVEVLEEVKKMPVCKTVTKQQCDSKWVINEEGVKVWDGNENCREVSWEDCTLEDRIMAEEVPTYSCKKGETLTYSSHLVIEQEVFAFNKICQPRGNPVCTQRDEMECTIVEWEECRDEIIETCKTHTLNNPYQTYHHILRCSIGHDRK